MTDSHTAALAADAVSRAFGIAPSALLGKVRTGFIAEARFALYFLLMERGDATEAEVSRLVGKTTGTVSHGVKRWNSLRTFDKTYAARTDAARRLFSEKLQATTNSMSTTTDHPPIEIPAGVPRESDLSGVVVNDFTIVTASDIKIARVAINMAAVRGSVGGIELVYECAGPEVMLEQRKIERWAVVERRKGQAPAAILDALAEIRTLTNPGRTSNMLEAPAQRVKKLDQVWNIADGALRAAGK